MRRKRLILPVGILLGVLAIYNVAIHVSAGKSQRRHLLERIEAMAPSTDCIFLGNSLVEAGCDVGAFKAAWPASETRIEPINLALGATSPVEHCLILRRALRQPQHLNYLVYGFFDDQLTSPVSGDWSDLVGNRALSYYFPAEAGALYAPGSWFKPWQLRVTGSIPMLAERSSLWGKVELLRRSFDEV